MVKRSENFSELMKRYTWIREITDEAISKRSLVSEFHGIEQELRDIQKSLIDSYDRTKPIKHPRDKGDQREEILRHFLSEYGLIPSRYSISTHSSRVVSSTGHISPEVDIVLFDKEKTITLKKYNKTLSYLPIESVYGTIQVKSKLTKKELISALDNIREFKSVKPNINVKEKIGNFTLESGLFRRFGIIFAYEYEFEWGKIVDIIKKHGDQHGISTLPNLIVILDKGHFRLGNAGRYCWHQSDLEAVTDLVVHGFPDHDGSCLLNFYLILIDLLQNSFTGVADIFRYVRLPMTAGSHSYSFSHGSVAEVALCREHGSYLKRINESMFEKILSVVSTSTPVNCIRALDTAQGRSENLGDYEKQPATVRIYNPRDLPFNEIISNPSGSLTFESIEVDEMTVWLPWLYVVEDQLIDPCPFCKKLAFSSQKGRV